MRDDILLLFLRELFPGWDITIDRHRLWRATGRILISASSAEELIDCLAVADPGAWTESPAWHFLTSLPDEAPNSPAAC
ncbi:hypothetical protein [Actinomadura sp. 9N407]|uniref:hypothetical protein n=1 Tax=Actinomadura sp. 9N407 TaxID=3375154 RepID=UPI00379F4E9B